MNTKYVSTRGFTLIELLVVVIIIAILAAIAVPQYKHAALKSRFSTVMPMAKSIADAQEVYFQGRQMYALSTDELDVTPVTAENTSVTLSQTDGYDYVMAQRSDVPGTHYIIYQKYSENYPSEIHCEAEDENADANWLCGVLSNNNSIGKTVTAGYTTYIINGSGAGFPVGYNALMERVDCTQALAQGYTCSTNIDEESGTATQTVCTQTVENDNVCFETQYNSDGSYLRYGTNAPGAVNTKVAQYDKDGTLLAVWERYKGATSGNENGGYDYIYDAQGNLIGSKKCETRDTTTNQCTTYYDHGFNYEYTNGQVTALKSCNNISLDGSCSGYQSSNATFTYQADGKLDTASASTRTYKYIYDSNGNLVGLQNQSGGTSYRLVLDDTGTGMLYQQCRTGMTSSGECTVWKTQNDKVCFDAIECFTAMQNW